MKIRDAVRAMHPPRYTRSEAASMVGRSPDTLRRWKREGTHKPSDARSFGALRVDLYTNDDIRTMRKLTKKGKDQ